MDALDIIRRDVEKSRSAGIRRAALGGVVCLVSLGLGLGWRRDWVGLDSAGAAFAIGAGVVGLAGLAALSHGRGRRAVVPLAVLVLLLGSGRALGGGMRIPYATSEVFWNETATCLVKGLVTCTLTAILAALLLRYVLPMSTKRGLVATSLVPAMGGILMLMAHCPSDHLGHVAIGHWLTAALMFPVSYAILRATTKRQLAPVLERPAIAPDALDAILRDERSS
jgi:hypothetical protein